VWVQAEVLQLHCVTAIREENPHLKSTTVVQLRPLTSRVRTLVVDAGYKMPQYTVTDEEIRSALAKALCHLGVKSVSTMVCAYLLFSVALLR
jgi:hypothetical protein